MANGNVPSFDTIIPEFILAGHLVVILATALTKLALVH